MKKVYIILTHTGTMLSKVIRISTGAEFSHISISLDKNLNKMYSFGRLRPYNPFIGGMVHEGPFKGTFKRFNKTVCAIYELEVTNEQYNKIEYLIMKMYEQKEKLKFNVLGLFANGLHISIKREDYFYCAEFIKTILEESDLYFELPELVRPVDFQKIKRLNLIYKGRLNEYIKEDGYSDRRIEQRV